MKGRGTRSLSNPAWLKSPAREQWRSHGYERGNDRKGEHAGRTRNDTYRRESVRTRPGCWLGGCLALASGAHGGHRLTERGGGAWRALPALAGAHVHRLV